VDHGRLFRPEDLALLEQPDRDAWQRPEQIMDALRTSEGRVVVDIGAGSGWFTIRLARRVRPGGHVFAEDVQRQMIESIARRVEREQLDDVVTTVLGTRADPGLPPDTVDAVLIVDAYSEMDEPVQLLRNVARALREDGRIGIVNFKKDGHGPGPEMHERVDPERVIADAQAAGLHLLERPDFLPYQYMLIFGKQPPAAQ
jgi:ubiquinone/menaquinone biosynthesis C-methylase UbiE